MTTMQIFTVITLSLFAIASLLMTYVMHIHGKDPEDSDFVGEVAIGLGAFAILFSLLL